MVEALRASNVPEIERYTFGSLIGRGSMGAVYEATDADGRVVALKILHAEVAEHEMAITRFEREVQLARRIEHPAVPEIFDWGQLTDGRLYLAMERLHGDSLEGWWETPGRSRALAMELLLESLGPLAAAHRLGIVHRDLKPENVFVIEPPDARGRVRLLDFGIARDLDEDAKSKTATGVAVGTPVYMSPEQATKPRLASLPTDVWSFGVMMYEALCGELPFDGDTPHAVIIAVATAAHVPLVERAPGLHPDLLALVERCLQKDPSRRPRDAGAVEELLGALLARPEVVQTIDGFAATPPFRLSSRPSAMEAVPLELRDRSSTLDESSTPSSSGLRRISPPRRRLLPIAALVLLLVGAGVWAWSAFDVAPSSTSNAPQLVRSNETNETNETNDVTAEELADTSDPTTEPPPAETDLPEEIQAPTPFDDEGPGPAPEVSAREWRPRVRVDTAAREDVTPVESVDGDGADPNLPEPSEITGTTANAPNAPTTATVAPTEPTPTPTPTVPTTSAMADTSSATDTSSAMTPAPAPTKRTVRRVVRRPATNTPTRPGFVTF